MDRERIWRERFERERAEAAERAMWDAHYARVADERRALGQNWEARRKAGEA